MNALEDSNFSNPNTCLAVPPIGVVQGPTPTISLSGCRNTFRAESKAFRSGNSELEIASRSSNLQVTVVAGDDDIVVSVRRNRAERNAEGLLWTFIDATLDSDNRCDDKSYVGVCIASDTITTHSGTNVRVNYLPTAARSGELR